MKFVCVLLAVTCLVVAAAEESATILTIRKAMKELKKLEKEYSRGTVSRFLMFCTFSLWWWATLTFLFLSKPGHWHKDQLAHRQWHEGKKNLNLEMQWTRKSERLMRAHHYVYCLTAVCAWLSESVNVIQLIFIQPTFSNGLVSLVQQIY